MHGTMESLHVATLCGVSGSAWKSCTREHTSCVQKSLAEGNRLDKTNPAEVDVEGESKVPAFDPKAHQNESHIRALSI